MSWKYNKGAAAGAAQPAPATHALPPPVAAASAGMPAFVPPPANVPPAAAQPAAALPAQPATEAPRRRRRSASEMAAAQVAAPAQVAQQTMFAAPVQPQQAIAQPQQMAVATVAQPAAPMLAPGGFLALFVPKDPSKTAAAAVLNIANQEGGEPNIFPTIGLTGGQTGGLFDFHDMNEEGSDDDLPSGRNPFIGLLIGYRLLFLGWPAAFVENGPTRTPRMRGTISSNEGEAADVATAAFKRYTFRTRVAKGTPEPFYDDRIHPAMCVEALMYIPKSGIMCVRSTWTYDSMTSTMEQINSAFPKDATGVPMVSPTPVVVSPDTWQTAGSKSRPGGWPEHGVKFTPPNTSMKPEVHAELNATIPAFAAFYAEVGQDPGLIDAMTKWAAHDLPVQAVEVLREIADT